jgi:predicted AAA+ superfamily ATPase
MLLNMQGKLIDRFITPKVSELLSFFPVVGIVGPRQAGKTTLVKELSNRLEKPFIYIDLENPRDDAKLFDPVLFFENNIEKCIIIDEIQRRKDLFPILRSMVDQKKVSARFIILGSASPDLIRDSSESLAGRIAYQELSPFNYIEIEKVADNNKHWLWGGFPDALLAPDKEMNFNWYHNFVQTYIERDLPMLGLSVHPNQMRKIWSMVAGLHGSILNKSLLTKSLEISIPTLNKYLSFLEEAFIIRILQSFSMNIRKRLVKSPKIYIRDTGILHYLLNINDLEELQGHFLLGNSWEGYVIEQILQLLKPGYGSFFYRTREGAECDLVIIKGNKVSACVEIKYTSAPKLTKSLVNSINDTGSENNFIVTPNTDNFLISKNIRVCKLYDFLKKYLPEL